jgi:hypothetical protein
MSNPVSEMNPSPWARERFGDVASALLGVLPAAIQQAHCRASAAHLSSELASNDAYGSTLHVTQNEELLKRAREIPGVVTRKPVDVRSRFELVVVEATAVVLYPWRFATDRKTQRESARMRTPMSDVRKALLALAPRRVDPQLTLEQADIDPVELDAQYADEQALIEQLASRGRVVVVGYGSTPAGGVFELGWGDVELVDDETGTVFWHTWELLPMMDMVAPQTATGPRAVRKQVRAGRFDDAPLNDDLGLTPRAPLSEVPTSEAVRPRADAGIPGSE